MTGTSLNAFGSSPLRWAAIVVTFVLVTACSSGSNTEGDAAAVGDSNNSVDPDQSTDSPPGIGTAQNGVIDSQGVFDIYNAVFTERSADCATYVNDYGAMPQDIRNQTFFDAEVTITATDSECTFLSNSVPNHDFNDETAAFAGGAEGATITAQSLEHSVTRFPSFAESPTFVSQSVKNGIFLNGVRLDIATAGCYRPTDPSANEFGEVGIGCGDNDPWLLDALGTESKFGADEHNAHTQPGGLYHYHGSPEAMFDNNPGPDGSPVIGFAADGYPIYGSFFLDDESGMVRRAISGYTRKTGTRGTRSDTNPGGEHSGRYVDDWEFTDAGDLDECNGMTVGDQYGYYVTDSYPWVIKCLRGTPDSSFVQGGGGSPQGPPPPQ